MRVDTQQELAEPFGVLCRKVSPRHYMTVAGTQIYTPKRRDNAKRSFDTGNLTHQPSLSEKNTANPLKVTKTDT